MTASDSPEARPTTQTPDRRVRFFAPDALTAVWVVLVGAGLLSYELRADHAMPTVDLFAAAVVLIGFVKAWIVGRYYMETRDSTTALRILFDAWVVLSTVAVIGSILLL